jgi:hypothetical protein
MGWAKAHLHKYIVIQHLPVVATLACTNVEIEPKLQEHRGWEPLGEDVSEL